MVTSGSRLVGAPLISPPLTSIAAVPPTLWFRKGSDKAREPLASVAEDQKLMHYHRRGVAFGMLPQVPGGHSSGLAIAISL